MGDRATVTIPASNPIGFITVKPLNKPCATSTLQFKINMGWCLESGPVFHQMLGVFYFFNLNSFSYLGTILKWNTIKCTIYVLLNNLGCTEGIPSDSSRLKRKRGCRFFPPTGAFSTKPPQKPWSYKKCHTWLILNKYFSFFFDSKIIKTSEGNLTHHKRQFTKDTKRS